MPDSVEDRADEFEQKVASAGSTEDIVKGLVIGAKRNQTIVKWLAISLALDVMLSIAMGILGFVAFHNSQTLKTQAIAACVQTNKNSAVINEFLDLLIEATKQTPVLTPDQKAERIKGYVDLVIILPDCQEKASNDQ